MNVDNNSMELEMELWNYKYSYLVIAKRAGPGEMEPKLSTRK